MKSAPAKLQKTSADWDVHHFSLTCLFILANLMLSTTTKCALVPVEHILPFHRHFLQISEAENVIYSSVTEKKHHTRQSNGAFKATALFVVM